MDDKLAAPRQAAGTTAGQAAGTAPGDVWELLAPTWEKRQADIEETVADVRTWLVDRLAPEAGQTIVELAAGVGNTGFDAAERIGREGRLLVTDGSPTMVEAARRRGDARGIGNADFRVVDATDIALDDDSADGVICRFGYMLMSDPDRALAETRRVLRPGGRLVLAVWGPPQDNPFFTIPGAAAVQLGLVPPPDPTAPGPFRLGDETRLRDALATAGFTDVDVEAVPAYFHTEGAEDCLGMIEDTGGGLAPVVRALDPGTRSRLADLVTEALAPYATDDGYDLRGRALCAAARA
jgi:SAM-dependent methyltransferase